MGRDVGKLGEEKAEALCSEAGILSQTPDNDEKAWDLLLEFDLEDEESATSSAPLDLDYRHIKSFVQVKSTDKEKAGDRRVAISLDNWKYLTSGTSHPCFILRNEFDGENDPQRIFLIHIGKEIIKEVMKRLREAQDQEGDLNDKTKTISYDEKNLLEEVSGKAIRKEIVNTVKGGPRNYRSWKESYLSEVGYEGIKRRITGKLSVPDSYSGSAEDLYSDFSVGLLDSPLEFDIEQVEDMRFGNPSPVSTEKNKISVEPKIKREKARLIFSYYGKEHSEKFWADLIIPNKFIRKVPKDKIKVRFSIEFADLIVNESDSNASLKMNFPQEKQPIRLPELRPLNNLISFLNSHVDKGYTIEVIRSGEEKRTIYVERKRRRKSSKKMFAFRQFNLYLSSLLRIVEKVGNREVDVTLENIKNSGERYKFIYGSLDLGKVSKTNITYERGRRYEKDIGYVPSNVAVPYPVTASTSSHHLIACVVLLGKPELLDSLGESFQYRIVSHGPGPLMRAELAYVDLFEWTSPKKVDGRRLSCRDALSVFFFVPNWRLVIKGRV